MGGLNCPIQQGGSLEAQRTINTPYQLGCPEGASYLQIEEGYLSGKAVPLKEREAAVLKWPVKNWKPEEFLPVAIPAAEEEIFHLQITPDHAQDKCLLITEIKLANTI